MTIFDEARSIQGMLNLRGMTQSELAALLGVSQPYIANKLRLLRYSPEMQSKIVKSGISERHARTLLRLSEESADRALDIIVRGKMNTAECEILVDRLRAEETEEPQIIPEESDAERLHALEDMIEKYLSKFRLFGVAARAKRESLGGKIYINICIG